MRIQIKEGDLVGFKAAPGADCRRLFEQVINGCGSQDWSGIYVQLNVTQALHYVPNQYDRGEEMSCMVSLRVKPGRSLNIIVFNEPTMANPTVASTVKANMVRHFLRNQGYTDIDNSKPLPVAMGDYGIALLLIQKTTS
jgi:hypothetical protein